MVGLLHGRVHAREAGDALKRAGRLHAALADLIVGREQDRLRRRGGLGGADRVGEVAPDQRTRVHVVDLQLGERLVVVDAREPEQRRDQIGVVGRNVELAAPPGSSGLETRNGTRSASS